MNYTDYALEALQKLTAIDSPSGFTSKVSEFVMQELESMGYAPTLTKKGGVLCCLGGEDADNGLLLLAHIDTLGGMVAEVKQNGRLRLTPIGGLSPINTETENCRIYTREGKIYTGTFQLTDASVHVNLDYKTAERTYKTMEVVVDEKTRSRAETENLGIETGDYVCFDPRTVLTESGYIKSRFLDDKLSAAILLALAKKLKDENRVPDRRLYLHFTVYEETGHGAAASVPAGVTELLSVDMGCVGEGLKCDEHMVSVCVKDSAGPSSYEMTARLIALAKELRLGYAADVYPAYRSDADAALSAGCDACHGLIGPGVYASHGYERSHIDGVENTLKLAEAYALS